EGREEAETGARNAHGGAGYHPSAMRAAIVAVGSELLGPDRLDTNSLLLTGVLEAHGVELRRKLVVGDDRDELAGVLRDLLAAHDLVLVTGGLGPTTDDVTREGAADALGRTLRLDEAVLATIEERFRAFGREMPAVNRRQALVPDRAPDGLPDGAAEVLPNLRGSAPGLRLDAPGGAALFLFPGVPRELKGMVEERLVPWLAHRSGGARLERIALKVASMAESAVEERIAPAYEEFGKEAITVLAGSGEITVRCVARGPEEERRARLRTMEERLAGLLGDAVYTRREDDTLEAAVGRLLLERCQTLVTAESCTGGLVAERLTRVPGSSGCFLGGAVTYTNRLKTSLLGDPEAMLAENGAVSEPVARAMAEGARRHLEADWAVAITGIAGPDGGSEEKPVGTVHLAWARPDGTVDHRRVRFPGSREWVRALSAQAALEGLRRRLLA
ncbi:MAG TPA: CinA family nicotinamide mononucleotide deamidase-related protein, partial [Thermoanaerobaculia bacterium]|nr:CinA family nicotinamide mononucleotide deamidase-related protein [Thermoanaerobaculia bacterium]